MSEHVQRRRVLLAAAERERAEFRELFQAEPLRSWEAVEADSLERARFVLQLDPCDVLLLDGSLYGDDAGAELSWLVGQRRSPVLLTADADPETVADALRRGVHCWLPGEMARRQAGVLAVVLDRLAEFDALQRRDRETVEALEDCRRQVSRLVNLLWEAAPAEGRSRWFTQRSMLARLEEEVVRAGRYGGPLAVVLGEAEGLPRGQPPGDEAQHAASWTVERIGRVKRRSDVAGQYGLQGFMMILPQTGEAGAAAWCRRLRQLLQQPAEAAGPFGPLRVHLGIAEFSADVSSVKGLLRRAEERLERDKRGPAEEA